MKTKLILIFSLNLLFSNSLYAANECSEYLSDEKVPPVVLQEPASSIFSPEDLIQIAVVQEPKPMVKLEPVLTKDGDTYWGYYECAQCSNEVSAKPGERQCIGCGKPHTTEPLDEIAPAMFRKTRVVGNSTYNELYLVNPGRLSNDRAMQRLAEEGVADECPFCSVSDFDLEVGCKGCGAETDNLNDIRKYALRKQRAALKASTRISTADTEMAQAQGIAVSKDVTVPADIAGLSLPQIEAELKAIDKENNRRNLGVPISQDVKSSNATRARAASTRQRLIDKIHLTKRGAMILAASTLIATTPVGYIWGTTSYTHMAEVVEINPKTVTVEYFDGKGQIEDVVLNRPADEQAQWHIGEQVELYFVNWKFGNPTGGERGNGDVLNPMK